MRTLAGAIKNRAVGQASANTETKTGRVIKVYTDAVGNVTGADVQVQGEAVALRNVRNASSLRLFEKMSVVLNYRGGSRLKREIIGAAGAESGGIISSVADATSNAVFGDTSGDVDYSASPFLLIDQVEGLDASYLLRPGANTLLESTAPVETSGGLQPGLMTISAKVLIVTSLPDPATSGLADGTLADLVTSYYEPLGMYRLDKAAGVWRRRDVGGSGGGGGGNVSDATDTTAGVVRLASAGPAIVPNTNDPRLSDDRKPLAHKHSAADIDTGVFARARLATASGTPSANAYPAYDGTWKEPPTGSGGSGSDEKYRLHTVQLMRGENPVVDPTLNYYAPNQYSHTFPKATDGSTLWFVPLQFPMSYDVPTSSTDEASDYSYIYIETKTGSDSSGNATGGPYVPTFTQTVSYNGVVSQKPIHRPIGVGIIDGAGVYENPQGIFMTDQPPPPKSGDRMRANIANLAQGVKGVSLEAVFRVYTTDPSLDPGDGDIQPAG